MGFTQNDIEMLRERVPEQFRADPARTLNPTFQNADAVADYVDAGVDLRSEQDEIAEAVARPSRDIVAERIETEEQIRREIMNGDGSITSIAVQAQKDGGLQARTEAEKRKDKGVDVALIAMLNDKIAALDLKLDELEGKLDATEQLLNLLDKGETLDPNNPEHKKLMDAAGIPENQREGLTREELLAHQERLQQEWKATQEQKAEAEAQLRQHTDHDLSDIQERAEANGDTQAVENTDGRNKYLTADERSEGIALAREAIDAAEKNEDVEQRLLTLEDLDQFKGTDEYAAKIDEFIASADVATIERLADDPTTDPTVIERIGLHNFYDELSYLDDFKGTPDYQMYVQMAVDDAPESVRDALRREPDLSEEIQTALYEPYSDELEHFPITLAHSLWR